MKVLLVKPANESIEKYTRKLEAYGIDYEVMDYPIDSKGMKDEGFRIIFAEKMYQIHKETIDAIQFFSREWTNPDKRLFRGLMFNKFYSGYLLSYTRLRTGFEGTGIHELFHKVDNWVFVYLGIRLEDIVGVKDWDDCVVHAEAPGYKNYEYEEVWKKVAPYVKQALAKKRHIALVGYMQALLIKLRAQLAVLQAQAVTIEAMGHPVPGFPVTYKYGVADDNYALTGRHLGTDYGTPIGTPVLAPVTGTIVASGTTKSLGNFCHFKYTHDGKTYVARFLHLQTVPKQGKYQKGQIMAYTGNTGFSEGPHLHTDIWLDDVRLDLINKNNWGNMTIDPETHFSA